MDTTQLLDWLAEPSIFKAVVGFIILVILSFIPFMPMALIYGALGFAYPYWLAFLLNSGGTMLGVILMFILCRNGLSGFYERKFKVKEMNSKFVQLLQTNSFLTILIARSIPVIPTVVVNVMCAMFQTPLNKYGWATFIGKLPSIFIFTLVGNQLHDQNFWVFLLLLFYIVIIGIATYRLKGEWQEEKKLEA